MEILFLVSSCFRRDKFSLENSLSLLFFGFLSVFLERNFRFSEILYPSFLRTSVFFESLKIELELSFLFSFFFFNFEQSSIIAVQTIFFRIKSPLSRMLVKVFHSQPENCTRMQTNLYTVAKAREKTWCKYRGIKPRYFAFDWISNREDRANFHRRRRSVNTRFQTIAFARIRLRKYNAYIDSDLSLTFFYDIKVRTNLGIG